MTLLLCTGAGQDEETKKQKQKALIDAAYNLKTENTEKNGSNSNVDGAEDSGDGKHYVFCQHDRLNVNTSMQWPTALCGNCISCLGYFYKANKHVCCKFRL